MDTKLIIASLNFRGMNNPVKRSTVYSWMRRQYIDILRLQETYLQELDPSWSNEFPDTEMYHSFGTKHSRGVSVMVQCPDLTATLVASDSNGRFVTIYVQLSSFSFYLTAVYAPVQCSDRTGFLSTLSRILSAYPNNVVCGISIVFWIRILIESLFPPGSCERQLIMLYIVSLTARIVDIYRERHPTIAGVTWFQPHNNLAERLHMFLASNNLVAEVNDVSTKPANLSGHHSVLLSIQNSNVIRGPRYWKLNVVFLQEDQFRSDLAKFWESWQFEKERLTTLLEWWDIGKILVKQRSIRYGVARKRRHQKHRQNLDRSLQRSFTRLQSWDLSAGQDIERFKTLLQQLDKENIRGQHTRCRAVWMD